MQEKVLAVHISDVICTNISYLIQRIIDSESSLSLSEAGLISTNYRLLSPELKKFVDEMTLDIVNAMKQYLDDTQTYASLYMALPSIIREFIEAGP